MEQLSSFIVNFLTVDWMFETCLTSRPASPGLDRAMVETSDMFQKSAPKKVNLLSSSILGAMNNKLYVILFFHVIHIIKAVSRGQALVAGSTKDILLRSIVCFRLNDSLGTFSAPQSIVYAESLGWPPDVRRSTCGNNASSELRYIKAM